MSLSKLAVKCQACPFVDICEHKEMETLGIHQLLARQEPANVIDGFQKGINDIDANIIELIREIACVAQLPEGVLHGKIQE